MVEKRADSDRMALYDVNRAIENEMYTRHHFDWSHPDGIRTDVMNIRVMSIGKCPMPIAIKRYSVMPTGDGGCSCSHERDGGAEG